MANTPKAAQRDAEPTATASAPGGLDMAALDAELIAGEQEFNETQAPPEVAYSEAGADAMVAAAEGRQVSVLPPLDYAEASGKTPRDVRGPSGVWNGRPTRFQLGFPLMRNLGELRMEDEWVTFDVNPVLDARGKATGQFIGTGGPDDESGSVANLYSLGMFKNTAPYRHRVGRQAGLDQERGVYEPTQIGANPDGSPIWQEPMLSLQQPDGEQVLATLRRSHGYGSPAAMRQAEQIARVAGQEAAGSRTPVGARSE